MTVASETSRSGPYIGNGVTIIFNYGFRILNENHLRVIRAEAGIETELVIDADYIVSDVGEPAGGQIALLVAPTANQTVTILRDVPFTQEMDLENQGAYYAETVEAAFDQAAMRDQQLNERLDRALVVPVSADAGALESLIANVVLLAGNVDDINTVAGIVGDVSDVAAIAADVSTVAANDLNVSAVADNSANINTVASIAGAVSTVAAIDDQVETVALHSAELPVITGNMAAVVTVAGIAPAVSAVAAIDDDVSTVASNVLDVTNFADVYQGPKANDPLTRRDGSPLLNGDMVFNTTLQRIRLYNGAAWGSLSVGRERLTADRSYFVRTNGNDANDGLANTAGGAWRTLQHAWDWITANIDAAGYVITIMVGPGTYTTGVNMNKNPGGFIGKVKWQGDLVAPSNVLIDSPTTAFQGTGSGLDVDIAGFKVVVASALTFQGVGVFISGQGIFNLTAMDFGACGAGHMIADTGGYLTLAGSYTISGNAPHHIQARTNGLVSMHGPAVTLTGIPAFSRAFAVVESLGRISSSASFTGTATGVRYELSNGIFQVGSNIAKSSSQAYLPGTVAGVVGPGGLYLWNILDLINVFYREKLQEARTYYVRTDGDDTNDGRANTTGGAFRTIQKAIDTVAALDLTYNVTIQVADGTYTTPVNVSGQFVGSGTVTIVGNTATPANVIVSVTSNHCFVAQSGAKIILSGMELRTTTSGQAVFAIGAGSEIKLTVGIRFGACAGTHIRADANGYIRFLNDYAIVGGAGQHVSVVNGGVVEMASFTVTITGTPAFVTSFILAQASGLVSIYAVTWSGPATGTRYSVVTNAVINTFGQATTYLPGSGVGSTATGGQYA